MARQLKGTLQDLHTTQLLHLINLAKKTGILRVFEGVPTGRDIIMGDGETKRPEVVPGKEKVSIAFQTGKLLHATNAAQDGHLSTVLHKAGKLNDEQYRVIRQRAAQASDKALALLLISANYVSRSDIVTAVQKHTLGVVFDVMTWEKEPFIFEEGAQPDVERIVVPIDLENVIIEGTRINRRNEQLVKELPNLDFALKYPDQPTDKFKKVQLSSEEWRVVSFISPRNTIRQIAKACNLTDMEIRRIVYGLMSAGLVELMRPVNTDMANAPKRPAAITSQQRPIVNKLIDRIKNL